MPSHRRTKLRLYIKTKTETAIEFGICKISVVCYRLSLLNHSRLIHRVLASGVTIDVFLRATCLGRYSLLLDTECCLSKPQMS